MGDIMRKKIFFSITILSIFLWLLIPIIKFNFYRNHYDRFGSFAISEYVNDMDLSYVTLKVKGSEYNDRNIEITDFLYYEELLQLSFGFISSTETDMFYYEIRMEDENKNELGRIMTLGETYFYNKSIEKIHCFLDERLLKDNVYKVIITDENRNIVGVASFINS